MTLLGLFNKRASGSVARERLQLILAHERSETGQPDLVITLREEILAVIARHVSVERDKVKVTLERGEGVSTLGLDIELPLAAAKAAAAKTRAEAAPAKGPDKGVEQSDKAAEKPAEKQMQAA